MNIINKPKRYGHRQFEASLESLNNKIKFLFIGGVINCGTDITKNYTLEEGASSINLTICGNPQPELVYTFQGKTEEAKMIEKFDDSTKKYKYKIDFEKIDRKVCGSTLEFKATGFKDWQDSSIIHVKCKNSFRSTKTFKFLILYHTIFHSLS